MNRKKIVAGNWKMNTNFNEALELLNFIQINSTTSPQVEKILFPPFTFIKCIKDALSITNNIKIGAQNFSEFKFGAYTGEVSADMLKSISCDYVLIGHSERRRYYNETSEQIILKIEQALLADLKIIFCFGENLEHRKSNSHFNIVKTQLNEVLSRLPKDKINQLVLAYEPVWAIGTGETASPVQAQEMHLYIRTVIAQMFSEELAQHISILYGGSCNSQNAKELFDCPDVDGGLIGGASLIGPEFCKIINSF
jgi:triosephosphate isomerase